MTNQCKFCDKGCPFVSAGQHYVYVGHVNAPDFGYVDGYVDTMISCSKNLSVEEYIKWKEVTDKVEDFM